MAASWRLVNVAPAGRPVVPEVNTTHDGTVGIGDEVGTVPSAPVGHQPLDVIGRRDDERRVDDVEAGAAAPARSAGG